MSVGPVAFLGENRAVADFSLSSPTTSETFGGTADLALTDDGWQFLRYSYCYQLGRAPGRACPREYLDQP